MEIPRVYYYWGGAGEYFTYYLQTKKSVTFTYYTLFYYNITTYKITIVSW